MNYRKLLIITLILCIIFTGCAESKDTLSISRFNSRDILNTESDLINIITGDNKYSLIFTVTNNTCNDINYGTKWYLEMLDEENWYTIEFKLQDSYDWLDVLLVFYDGEQKELNIPLYGYYETPLPSGEYRLVQPVDGKLFSLNFSL